VADQTCDLFIIALKSNRDGGIIFKMLIWCDDGAWASIRNMLGVTFDETEEHDRIARGGRAEESQHRPHIAWVDPRYDGDAIIAQIMTMRMGAKNLSFIVPSEGSVVSLLSKWGRA